MACMAAKTYAIDRIERGKALCECLQTGERITIEQSALPKHAKEGDILRQMGDAFVIDETHTEERQRDLTNRLQRLFERHE